MKRSSYENLPTSSAEYVIADAKWHQSRGGRPVMSYRGIINPKKALNLAFLSINDNQFKDVIVAKVDSSSFTTNDRWSFFIQEEWPIRPKVGDVVRFYGKGIGYSVRGVDINGISCFYKTEKQERIYHVKQLAKSEVKEKADFEKNRTSLDQKYNNLPKVFRQRIDKFRNNNPDFRWKYESYEMFCCEQTLIIVKAVNKRLKAAASKKNLTVGEFNKLRPDTKKLILNKLNNMPYEKQLEAISGFDNGHSGNTFSCSMVLAKLYLCHPNYVVKFHGSLSPLVGSLEYGDISKVA